MTSKSSSFNIASKSTYTFSILFDFANALPVSKRLEYTASKLTPFTKRPLSINQTAIFPVPITPILMMLPPLLSRSLPRLKYLKDKHLKYEMPVQQFGGGSLIISVFLLKIDSQSFHNQYHGVI